MLQLHLNASGSAEPAQLLSAQGAVLKSQILCGAINILERNFNDKLVSISPSMEVTKGRLGEDLKNLARIKSALLDPAELDVLKHITLLTMSRNHLRETNRLFTNYVNSPEAKQDKCQRQSIKDVKDSAKAVMECISNYRNALDEAGVDTAGRKDRFAGRGSGSRKSRRIEKALSV